MISIESLSFNAVWPHLFLMSVLAPYSSSKSSTQGWPIDEIITWSSSVLPYAATVKWSHLFTLVNVRVAVWCTLVPWFCGGQNVIGKGSRSTSLAFSLLVLLSESNLYFSVRSLLDFRPKISKKFSGKGIYTRPPPTAIRNIQLYAKVWVPVTKIRKCECFRSDINSLG